MPADGPFVLRYLIDKSQLFGRVLRHSNDESSSEILVAFSCDALQSFVADASLNKLSVDGGIVDGDKAVGLEEVEKFIQEVVEILGDKLAEVIDVRCVKDAMSMMHVQCV